MPELSILQPVVVLAAWTMIMWLWMYATRIPAMQAAQVEPDKLANDPETTLDRVLPPGVQWKAHNYNHLHEAPTVFYAVALVLFLTGEGDGRTAILGCAYVGLRILHSLVQATFNKVMVRFGIFALSSIVLMALIALAARAVFLGGTA
ncbi:MAPEG family protein [Altererythrobacter salegens]|uniref:MAPEG family protein n=1 Tax=Croceibacterium salegens TaxID=1737568 RepID=A0A6I4SRH6_9SPHN|nr:MAPEG family protein [Croceibacterium salegens]